MLYCRHRTEREKPNKLTKSSTCKYMRQSPNQGKSHIKFRFKSFIAFKSFKSFIEKKLKLRPLCGTVELENKQDPTYGSYISTKLWDVNAILVIYLVNHAIYVHPE